ncbi:MAG TPA: hypothetical protein VMT34_07870 [Aggregatilineales bacterium]|nr:hypothetical protein [Aggregatilineales bacterium]
MRRTTAVSLLLVMIAALIAGCDAFNPPPLPTQASIAMGLTAAAGTLNAPPPGFEQVAFPQIDLNLTNLPSYRYTFNLSFDGVYSGTQDKVQGTIEAEVFSDELGGARRVLLKATGGAFGLQADRNVEAVRLGNDYYLVDPNKVCTRPTDAANRKIADLAASSFVGGIKSATPNGVHTVKKDSAGNEIKLWDYTFVPDAVIPPTLTLSEGGKLTIASGDLWVIPAIRAVSQYTITLNVENAILEGDRQVTGRLQASYQLLETGVTYNISIPFGC